MAYSSTSRKLFRVSMILDHSVLHDVMSVTDGKCFNLEVNAVKHGGTNKKGEPKSMPSGREFILQFASENPRFTNRQVRDAAEAINMKWGTAYSGVMLLKGAGMLEAVGQGEWRLTGRGTPPPLRGKHGNHNRANAHAALKNRRDHERAVKKGKKDGSKIGDRIIAVLKKKGGDVDLATIKTALGNKLGGSASPTITDMLRKKTIVRVSPGVYALPAVAANGAGASAH